MEKVQKPSNSECYKPSTETFRVYWDRSLKYDTKLLPFYLHNISIIIIVTWRLKAGKVKPEDMSIARQRLGKQVSTATDKQATI
jgi:hypothetical protein